MKLGPSFNGTKETKKYALDDPEILFSIKLSLKEELFFGQKFLIIILMRKGSDILAVNKFLVLFFRENYNYTGRRNLFSLFRFLHRSNTVPLTN